MRNHVLEVLKRTTATVAIAAMLLCGVTACSSGGYTDQRTIKYSDGGVYSGSVQEGKRSGYGTFSWTNGETYVGLWNDDQLNGKGTFTTSEGIMNCTPFVRQYGILFRKWGVFVCQRDNESTTELKR